MKTNDLVSFLAKGVTPLPANALQRSFLIALACGVLSAIVVMTGLFGVREDLLQAMGEWLLWFKFAFAGCLALAGWMAVNRLARPGVPLGRLWMMLLIPITLVWMASAVMLIMAEPALRNNLIFGTTWRSCPWNIALISLPLLATTLWAMRQLAPTQLSRAGASAGWLAGTLATVVYALHCPETALPFVAIWYVLGMAIPTVIGALLGPRLLRW